MMGIIDGNNEPYKKAESLKGKRANDPLIKRREQIEADFLRDLTALTRKYGLAIKADTYYSHGESYPEHVLEVASHGTAARYVVGDYRGIEWDAVRGDKLLPCTPEERDMMLAAVAAREEEDKAISTYDREISSLSFEAHRIAMDLGMQRWLAERPRVVTKPTCACGEVFRSQKKLDAHMAESGHR